MVLLSVITGPVCNYGATEIMPTDDCQYIYDGKCCGYRMMPTKGKLLRVLLLWVGAVSASSRRTFPLPLSCSRSAVTWLTVQASNVLDQNLMGELGQVLVPRDCLIVPGVEAASAARMNLAMAAAPSGGIRAQTAVAFQRDLKAYRAARDAAVRERPIPWGA